MSRAKEMQALPASKLNPRQLVVRLGNLVEQIRNLDDQLRCVNQSHEGPTQVRRSKDLKTRRKRLEKEIKTVKRRLDQIRADGYVWPEVV
jgi:hypothetical protein